jgi:hypothetical protein
MCLITFVVFNEFCPRQERSDFHASYPLDRLFAPARRQAMHTCGREAVAAFTLDKP